LALDPEDHTVQTGERLSERGDGQVTFADRAQAEQFVRDLQDVIARGARSGDWPITFGPQPKAARTVRYADRYGNLYETERTGR